MSDLATAHIALSVLHANDTSFQALIDHSADSSTLLDTLGVFYIKALLHGTIWDVNATPKLASTISISTTTYSLPTSSPANPSRMRAMCRAP